MAATYSQSPGNVSGEGAEAREKPKTAERVDGKEQVATFANGCFWCTEAVFAELKGVKSAVSGYTGGQTPNPTYKQVTTGTTGHAEALQITFDPAVISFSELLEVFWKTHDPTTLNRQGADVGTQYRSAIFYHDDQQRREAEHFKKQLDATGAFDAPIVTEITKFERFYPAEDYHQEYYANNPEQGYCQAVVRPKVEKFRKAFAKKLKDYEPSKKDGGKGQAGGPADSDAMDWSKVDWRKKLTPEQYHIMREAGTERAFTGKYWNFFDPGRYECAGCGLPLFESTAKFESECGWPSFDKTIAKDSIVELPDNKFGMRRIEIRCRRCDAHLGHVFDDGPTETGLRYCLNSAAMDFVASKDAVKESGRNEEPAQPPADKK